MYNCLPARPSSDRHGATFLLHLACVLLLAGLLVFWPKAPAGGETTAGPWLALEVVSSLADGEGVRLGSANGDSENSTGGDDSALAWLNSTTAAMAAQLFPVGPVLGWHPVPATLEHARAPPAAA